MNKSAKSFVLAGLLVVGFGIQQRVDAAHSASDYMGYTRVIAKSLAKSIGNTVKAYPRTSLALAAVTLLYQACGFYFVGGTLSRMAYGKDERKSLKKSVKLSKVFYTNLIADVVKVIDALNTSNKLSIEKGSDEEALITRLREYLPDDSSVNAVHSQTIHRVVEQRSNPSVVEVAATTESDVQSGGLKSLDQYAGLHELSNTKMPWLKPWKPWLLSWFWQFGSKKGAEDLVAQEWSYRSQFPKLAKQFHARAQTLSTRKQPAVSGVDKTREEFVVSARLLGEAAMRGVARCKGYLGWL